MVSDPTHIDRGVLDLTLTGAHVLFGARVGSLIEISDHSALFIDAHRICRQEVYLKKSVDWKLVRGIVKGLDWHEIISSPCPGT